METKITELNVTVNGIATPRVKIDLSTRQVWRDDKEVLLSRSEYEILAEMAKFQTVAISRAQLLRAIGWKGDGFETRTVDAHMYRLRQKIGPVVLASTGFGYRLDPSVLVMASGQPERAEAESLLVCPGCKTPLRAYVDLLRVE